MSLTYRTITNALARTKRNQRGKALRGQEFGTHDLGVGGQVTCSPWEGMYLDQCLPWSAGDNDALTLDEDLDRVLAQILSAE
jgi:hypothetical protein